MDAELKLPVPREFADIEKQTIVRSSMSRIWDASESFQPPPTDMSLSTGSLQEAQSQDLWMLLLVRTVTRAVPDEKDKREKEGNMEVDELSKNDKIRQVLFDYIMTNFPARENLALTWMNEEWYNDRIRRTEDPELVNTAFTLLVVLCLPNVTSNQTT